MHELRTLADARALRADLVPGTSLVVIGGGFVGAEVASTALALGLHVTIVEAAPAPVARVLGDEVGLMLAERWRTHGVDVRLRTGVATIRSDASGRVDSVVLTDGSELRADAVLVGVGVEPARELLPERPRGARASVRRRRRSRPLDGGGARRRRGGPADPWPRAPAPQPHYVWSDQFGLRLQVVGSPRPDDAFELDGGGDSFAVRYLDPSGAVHAGLLANRPAEAAELRRRLTGDALALAA